MLRPPLTATPRASEVASLVDVLVTETPFVTVARPLLPISPKTRIELMIEDNRTEEEKAEAIQREAEKHNYRLFDEVDLEP